MNKGKRLAVIVLAAGILAAGFGSREVRMTVARAAAGKGMLGLVEDAAEHPVVALTFDDGPSSRYTPELLDGLKERGIHATFFLMGKNIEGNEALVKRIQDEGHLIGNHTYNHVQLDKISPAKAKEEIDRTSNEIYEITGVYPSYLRPPYGAWKKNLELTVTMLPVFWDVDTLDWESKNVSSVLHIVENNVEDGSIILMHDGYQTSVDAAMKVIDLLTEQGYEFVTVDRLMVL